MASVTEVFRFDTAPGVSVVGAADTATSAGAPAAKRIFILAMNPPLAALTFAVPVFVPACKVISAIPSSPVVTGLAVVKPPRVVANVTSAPETGLPVVDRTVALTMTVLDPSAVISEVPEVSSMEPITTAAASTVILLVTLAPLLAAVARIVSVPDALPAVYCTVACPLMFVCADAAESVAPELFVSIVKFTVSSGTGFPFESLIVTVMAAVFPGFTVTGAADISISAWAGGPGTKTTSFVSMKPSAEAVIVAVPATVPACNVASAIPRESVSTGFAVVIVPRVVANVTLVPATGFPAVSRSVARSTTVSEPFATISSEPVINDIEPTR